MTDLERENAKLCAEVCELKKQIGVLEFQLRQRRVRGRAQEVTPLLFLFFCAVLIVVGMVIGRGGVMWTQ